MSNKKKYQDIITKINRLENELVEKDLIYKNTLDIKKCIIRRKDLEEVKAALKKYKKMRNSLIKKMIIEKLNN